MGCVVGFESRISTDFHGRHGNFESLNTVDSDTHSFEVSRKRSLQRIKEYTEKNWESKRALYEVINDASMVLTQYERGETFTWPIRITMSLVRINQDWKIRQVHFSFPGRGFPSVRILDE